MFYTRVGSVSKSVEKLIATIMLIGITVVTAASVYFFTAGFVSEKQESVKKAKPVYVKVEAGYITKVASIQEVVLYLRPVGSAGPVHVDRIYIYESEGTLVAMGYPLTNSTLEAGRVSVVVFAIDKSLSPGREYFIKLGLAGLGVVPAGSTTFSYAKSRSVYNVYILYVPGVCAQYVKSITKLREALKFLGKVEVVQDLETLDKVVKNAGKNTIIINTHGEVVPAPEWVWEGAGFWNKSVGGWGVWRGGVPKWQEWFKIIRDAIKRGAIWVNVGGWPFYYISNTTCVPSGHLKGFYQVGICECAGCSWGSWRGYVGYHYILTGKFECPAPGTEAARCYLPLGGTLFKETSILANLKPVVKTLTGYIPPSMHTHDVNLDRPCKFNINVVLTPLHMAVVDSTRWYGVYVIKLGEGYIIHVGYGATISEEERAALVTAGILVAIGLSEIISG